MAGILALIHSAVVIEAPPILVGAGSGLELIPQDEVAGNPFSYGQLEAGWLFATLTVPSNKAHALRMAAANIGVRKSPSL